jgi:hypothetical protein
MIRIVAVLWPSGILEILYYDTGVCFEMEDGV